MGSELIADAADITVEPVVVQIIEAEWDRPQNRPNPNHHYSVRCEFVPSMAEEPRGVEHRCRPDRGVHDLKTLPLHALSNAGGTP